MCLGPGPRLMQDMAALRERIQWLEAERQQGGPHRQPTRDSSPAGEASTPPHQVRAGPPRQPRPAGQPREQPTENWQGQVGKRELGKRFFAPTCVCALRLYEKGDGNGRYLRVGRSSGGKRRPRSWGCAGSASCLHSLPASYLLCKKPRTS